VAVHLDQVIEAQLAGEAVGPTEGLRRQPRSLAALAPGETRSLAGAAGIRAKQEPRGVIVALPLVVHSKRLARLNRDVSLHARAVTLPAMAEPIHEVLPGVLHWTARHPTAGLESGSHYLVEEGILIDPIAPPEGLDWFDGRHIAEILLTNRHHARSAFDLQDRLGATIRAPQTGMHELPGGRVQPYDFGEELSAGICPHAISETWPDETALEISGHRAIAIADGVINYDGLGFFADFLLGDDPEAEKQRLRDGFARLAAEVDFDHLLLAHGTPIVGDGREQLRRFAVG
jgi:hypothetical protein